MQFLCMNAMFTKILISVINSTNEAFVFKTKVFTRKTIDEVIFLIFIPPNITNVSHLCGSNQFLHSIRFLASIKYRTFGFSSVKWTAIRKLNLLYQCR